MDLDKLSDNELLGLSWMTMTALLDGLSLPAEHVLVMIAKDGGEPEPVTAAELLAAVERRRPAGVGSGSVQ